MNFLDIASFETSDYAGAEAPMRGARNEPIDTPQPSAVEGLGVAPAQGPRHVETTDPVRPLGWGSGSDWRSTNAAPQGNAAAAESPAPTQGELAAMVRKAEANAKAAPITQKASNWLKTGDNKYLAGGVVLLVAVLVWLKLK